MEGLRMSRLLLVEDDMSLALGIEFTLKDEGYDVIVASTIKEAKEIISKEKLDLIILDVNLPDGNGYDLCKAIREDNDVLIIFLTACDDEVNVVLGLEIGGDDYICKPFRVKELISRIKALLRRNSKVEARSQKFICEDIVVDSSIAVVKKNGKEIILTVQEYKLLLIFLNKPHVLMKRDDILRELIDGAEAFFDENTLSVYIKRLREKIENDSRNPQYIITQRGMGYKWNKDVNKE